MKKTALALKRPMNMGGQKIEPGVPVVVMETDLPWDSLLAALHCGYLIEHSVEPAQSRPEPAEERSAASEPPESPANDEPKEQPPAAEPAGGQPEASETPLSETGLTDSLVSALDREGIATVEQLKEFAGSNGSLSDLESLGPRQAKRIEAWLKNRQGE